MLGDPLPLLWQDVGHKAMPHQFLALLAIIAAIGLVRKSERAIGEETADQIRLVLDDGAMPLLTLP